MLASQLTINKDLTITAASTGLTIVQAAAMPGNADLHPSEHRPITLWEAARLQTFPDDFLFFGSRQIGNVVPPVFARRIADRIKASLMPGRQELTALQVGAA
jgi:site-specific DNA-cytosine methylase